MLRKLFKISVTVLFILIFSLGFNFLRIFQASSYISRADASHQPVYSVNCFQDNHNAPSRTSLISRVENEDKSALKIKVLFLPETFDIHRLAMIFSEYNEGIQAEYCQLSLAGIYPSSSEPLFIRICSLII